MSRRPTPIRSTLLAAVLLIGGGAADLAHADEPRYYRCGDRGQDLRDTPCPAGMTASAAPLPQDKVTPDQQRAARERAAHEAKQLDAQRRERERLETRRGPAATGIADGIRDRGVPASAPETQRKAPKDPKKRKPKDTVPRPKPVPKPVPQPPTAPPLPRSEG